MLQMLNVDQKKEGDDASDDEENPKQNNINTRSLNNLVEKKLILPNLQNKQHNNIKDPMNLSADFNNYDEMNNNGNVNNAKESIDNNINNKDPRRPKM